MFDKVDSESRSLLQMLDQIKFFASAVVNFYRVVGVVIFAACLFGLLSIHSLAKETFTAYRTLLWICGWVVGITGLLGMLGWWAVAQLIAGQERILAALLKDR